MMSIFRFKFLYSFYRYFVQRGKKADFFCSSLSARVSKVILVCQQFLSFLVSQSVYIKSEPIFIGTERNGTFDISSLFSDVKRNILLNSTTSIQRTLETLTLLFDIQTQSNKC